MDLKLQTNELNDIEESSVTKGVQILLIIWLLWVKLKEEACLFLMILGHISASGGLQTHSM